MNAPVLNLDGKQVGTVELPAEIFEYQVNVGLMHQYTVMQEANNRLGTHKTKRRGEINRTHAKWYRQKGTGRARHGNRAAPLFVGGGRAHGPIPHKYTKNMPKQMRRAAVKSAFAALARDGQLIFVDDFKMSEPKTKVYTAILKALGSEDQKTLVLLPARDEVVERAVRNHAKSMYLHANYANVRDLLHHDRVIIPLASLEVLKGILIRKPAAEEA